MAAGSESPIFERLRGLINFVCHGNLPPGSHAKLQYYSNLFRHCLLEVYTLYVATSSILVRNTSHHFLKAKTSALLLEQAAEELCPLDFHMCHLSMSPHPLLRNVEALLRYILLRTLMHKRDLRLSSLRKSVVANRRQEDALVAIGKLRVVYGNRTGLEDSHNSSTNPRRQPVEDLRAPFFVIAELWHADHCCVVSNRRVVTQAKAISM